MYLRTTQRKRKDGTIVEYYQLAPLCRSIARVCDLEVIDPQEEAGEPADAPRPDAEHERGPDRPTDRT